MIYILSQSTRLANHSSHFNIRIVIMPENYFSITPHTFHNLPALSLGSSLGGNMPSPATSHHHLLPMLVQVTVDPQFIYIYPFPVLYIHIQE